MWESVVEEPLRSFTQVNAPIQQSANTAAQVKSVKCSERGAFINLM